MDPTQDLLDDVRAAGGPSVILKACLNDRGGVIRLSVLVYDASRSQVLRLPFPRLESVVSYQELLDAAAFWTLILDGNVTALESD